MRFSVRLIQHLGSPREIVNLGILADKVGFDQAWFPSDKFMYNAWSMISALAENTRTIIVGANGTEPYAISPGEIAVFMATGSSECGPSCRGLWNAHEQMVN
jgi:alkanesulfonate monooxygenase SsuD/methylene tetrahydromethanopterin reductase-like flavin-dependent oxidoreductase (luciferase family)